MHTPTPEELQSLYTTLRATGLVKRLCRLAYDEDLGTRGRDITSELFIEPDARLRCAVVAREAGVLAGIATLPDLLAIFDPGGDLSVEERARDGAAVSPAMEVVTLDGPARVILALERTLLNILGRLSGVATATHWYLEAMGTGHKAALLDTRKTTPGLRVLEKYAVRCGGGRSHRIGLHDAVLIKDNHLAGMPPGSLAGRLTTAAERARASSPHPSFVEVEVDRLPQFEEVLGVRAGLIDIVLLDNFAVDALVEAVRLRDARGSAVLLEASGGVNLDTIGTIARTGVDRISVGAITHSSVSLDFGLDAR